jgi:hypothetical protein
MTDLTDAELGVLRRMVEWSRTEHRNVSLDNAEVELLARLLDEHAELGSKERVIAGFCDDAGIPKEWAFDPSMPNRPRAVNVVGRALWMRNRLNKFEQMALLAFERQSPEWQAVVQGLFDAKEPAR